MNSGRLKDLLETVERKYKIVAEDVTSYRGSLLIKCSVPKNKIYILKRVECDEKRLAFTYDLQKHIIENGFSDCECYVPYEEMVECDEATNNATIEIAKDESTDTANNVEDEAITCQLHSEQLLSFIDRESEWGLCEFVEGRESNFDDENELMSICVALADMHTASKGFACDNTRMAQISAVNRLGKLPAIFNKRLAELEKLRKKAMKDRKDFDIEYMKNSFDFIQWGREALEYIDAPAYALLVKSAVLEGGVSHCDLTYQNILLEESNGRVFFTGFESACFELNVYDVANLIRRKMRKCNWDFSIAMKMIEAYDRRRSLSEGEISTLKGILLFPQKFWRIANSYYNMNKAWTQRSMKDKLLEATAEKEDFSRFAQSLIREL